MEASSLYQEVEVEEDNEAKNWDGDRTRLMEPAEIKGEVVEEGVCGAVSNRKVAPLL